MPKQERGEHSRDNDEEKPLKKARYVWEVKGKYHLKNTQKNNNTIHINNNTIAPQSTDDVETSKKEHQCQYNCANSEAPDETCGSNKCCIESFLAKTEALMNSDIEDEGPANNNTIEGNISNEIPLTLVSVKPKNQEYYLQKWQARQIARGFVDNTINSVLESWINPPFDAADFVDNCANDGQVEDDAILMAIQSHGLQSSSLDRDPGLEESTRDNFENFQNELIKEQETNASDVDTMSCESSSSNETEQKDFLEVEDPMDFLNAAVSVAIQKKGLSYNY